MPWSGTSNTFFKAFCDQSDQINRKNFAPQKGKKERRNVYCIKSKQNKTGQTKSNLNATAVASATWKFIDNPSFKEIVRHTAWLLPIRVEHVLLTVETRLRQTRWMHMTWSRQSIHMWMLLLKLQCVDAKHTWCTGHTRSLFRYSNYDGQ